MFGTDWITGLARINPELAKLALEVSGSHLSRPWAAQFNMCRNLVKKYPEYAWIVGIAENSESNEIYYHPINLTRFMGLKSVNSLDRNFTEHGFKSVRGCNLQSELPERFRIDFHHWAKRVFTRGEFNVDSTPETVAEVTQKRKEFVTERVERRKASSRHAVQCTATPDPWAFDGDNDQEWSDSP
jgi:hypothetical protein